MTIWQAPAAEWLLSLGAWRVTSRVPVWLSEGVLPVEERLRRGEMARTAYFRTSRSRSSHPWQYGHCRRSRPQRSRTPGSPAARRGSLSRAGCAEPGGPGRRPSEEPNRDAQHPVLDQLHAVAADLGAAGPPTGRPAACPRGTGPVRMGRGSVARRFRHRPPPPGDAPWPERALHSSRPLSRPPPGRLGAMARSSQQEEHALRDSPEGPRHVGDWHDRACHGQPCFSLGRTNSRVPMSTNENVSGGCHSEGLRRARVGRGARSHVKSRHSKRAGAGDCARSKAFHPGFVLASDSSPVRMLTVQLAASARARRQGYGWTLVPKS
jgi:hypothetical protein